ncbi:alkaline phytoceramidase [Lentithecium fluviatile CBS 122367]|uniref:Alkaline phytoceramidase n=1 Tax=Lentithecium fluviatile CBS 122367 TaxID=1168545 RepID=A0A6G1J893_9PLEO|nr:alkaline phytoceramidase [Lentithecium fluviatile CBS 122367]
MGFTYRIPSFTYAPAQHGYWSPVTSTLNWCEEDYYATHYIAELVNTLTNLFFVFLAIKSIRSCIQNGHDKVWIAAFFVLLFVGIGSFLFHATLKYEMQLLDELSMIYLACTSFFAIFSHGKTKAITTLILVFTVSLAVFVSVYYHYLQDPVFHQNAFAILTAVNIFRGWYQMEHLLRPSRRAITSKKVDARDRAPHDQRDLKILADMWTLSLAGVAYIGIGFFIWNLDNIYCAHIRQWRRALGLPWGIVLEGHGWWHFFTSIASYYILTWLVWLRYCLEGQQDEVQLQWPSTLISLPALVRQKFSTSVGKGKEA